MPSNPRLSPEESRRIAQAQRFVELSDISGSLLSANSKRGGDKSSDPSFISVLIADARLEHLTLPRSFFNRSEIRDTSFQGTDLSESTANWNDFINVNFSWANLSLSDLRACVFKEVRFQAANLTGVDFRYCGFIDCHFSDADLTDAKLTLKAGKALPLSDEQKSVIDWQADDGEEPEGG